LHSRITTVNRDLSEKIEDTERTILQELHVIRKEIKDSHTREDASFSKRLAQIEMWKYMIMGGIVVITWVLAKSDISKFFKLIF
jgi:hypothetical protein